MSLESSSKLCVHPRVQVSSEQGQMGGCLSEDLVGLTK